MAESTQVRAAGIVIHAVVGKPEGSPIRRMSIVGKELAGDSRVYIQARRIRLRVSFGSQDSRTGNVSGTRKVSPEMTWVVLKSST